MKEENDSNKILKINDIIKLRFPPNIWDFIFYTVSLYALFTRNNKIGYIIVSFTTLYFFLNFIFDFNTILTDLNNDFSKLNLEKDYKKLTFWQKICWIDKKFICIKYSNLMHEMNISNEINKMLEKNIMFQNSLDNDLENHIMDKLIKNTQNVKNELNYELNYEVYVYLDGNIFIENILSIIYFLGITKKILIKKNILENYINDYTNYDELNNSIIKSKKKIEEHWGHKIDIENSNCSYNGHRITKKNLYTIEN